MHNRDKLSQHWKLRKWPVPLCKCRSFGLYNSLYRIETNFTKPSFAVFLFCCFYYSFYTVFYRSATMYGSVFASPKGLYHLPWQNTINPWLITHHLTCGTIPQQTCVDERLRLYTTRQLRDSTILIVLLECFGVTSSQCTLILIHIEGSEVMLLQGPACFFAQRGGVDSIHFAFAIEVAAVTFRCPSGVGRISVQHIEINSVVGSLHGIPFPPLQCPGTSQRPHSIQRSLLHEAFGVDEVAKTSFWQRKTACSRPNVLDSEHKLGFWLP